ncbi:hypothetical protein F3Y22_tig00113337pilonHSYRG00049 [Hibiscus syriacus]|uniref:RNase H type-1 domain-containing protein n=1 Tax=Hibiscus syriacus TaxID=106335 RepID=A0A6A2X1Y3_HIBSY|nr:hypothetical protein F3Y22_tig00113337pilonHSYRG00049 [Hibiscus syriacus]
MDWVKANVDGAMGGSNTVAAVGGVIRDSQGDWIIDFSRSLGICSALHAELWALHDTLILAWNMKYRRVKVEIECKLAANILNRQIREMDENVVVALVHEILDREWETRVNHVYRKTNAVAEQLAKMVKGCPMGEVPPSKVAALA